MLVSLSQLLLIGLQLLCQGLHTVSPVNIYHLWPAGGSGDGEVLNDFCGQLVGQGIDRASKALHSWLVEVTIQTQAKAQRAEQLRSSWLALTEY